MVGHVLFSIVREFHPLTPEPYRQVPGSRDWISREPLCKALLPSELEPDAGLFPLDEQKKQSDEDGEIVVGVLKEKQDEQGDTNTSMSHLTDYKDLSACPLLELRVFEGIKRLQWQLKGSVNGQNVEGGS